MINPADHGKYFDEAFYDRLQESLPLLLNENR